MGNMKQAAMTAATTLAVIWCLNQFAATRNLVQSALTGR